MSNSNLLIHSRRAGRGDVASTTKKGPPWKTGAGSSTLQLESTRAQILPEGPRPDLNGS